MTLPSATAAWYLTQARPSQCTVPWEFREETLGHGGENSGLSFCGYPKARSQP